MKRTIFTLPLLLIIMALKSTSPLAVPSGTSIRVMAGTEGQGWLLSQTSETCTETDGKIVCPP